MTHDLYLRGRCKAENLVKKYHQRAEYIEIRVEEIKETVISLAKHDVRSINEYYQLGGAIGVYDHKGWGFGVFNSLSSMEDILEQVISAARISFYENLSRPEAGAVSLTVNLLPEKRPDLISLSEKIDQIQRYNRIMLDQDKVISTQIDYHDYTKRRFFINSLGVNLEEHSGNILVHLIPMAMKNGAIQRDVEIFSSRSYEKFTRLENVLLSAAERAGKLLQGVQVQPGAYNVLFDQYAGGVLFHEAMGHLSEADLIYEHPVYYKALPYNRKVGVDGLDVLDDATLEGYTGSYVFDDEGVFTKPIYLLKNGFLTGRLHTRKTAQLFGESPTGNGRAINYRFAPICRMSNTYVAKGKSKVKDLLTSLDYGIYVKGAIGAQNNLDQYVLYPKESYLVENGKIGPLLCNTVLYGNIFDAVNNIVGIANDLEIYNYGCSKGSQKGLPVSMGSPHILIERVAVGGENLKKRGWRRKST